jgi:membrane fusion protein (multidrug efflux system)
MKGNPRFMKIVGVATGLFLVCALALVLAGCGARKAVKEEAATAVPVQVAEVVRESVSPTLSYSGGIEPGRKALLGAQMAGQVDKIHVAVGDRVRAGDLLVEMGGEQLTQVRAQFTAVEKDWQRMKSLLEKGAVTQQTFDQTNAAYEAAKAQYDLVRGSTEIRAPFGGVITAKYLDEGEVFTMMPTGAGAPAIVELAKLDTVKVNVALSERDRPLVRAGDRAVVTVVSDGGRGFNGVVKRVDPTLSASTRTATAEIVVPNPTERLRPGMFADVELHLAPRPAIVVSRDALVRQEGTAVFYVYVVEGGVAHRREPRFGDSYGAGVEVVDGLSAGDLVVTAGRYRLHEGSAVQMVEAGAAPEGAASEAPAPDTPAAGEKEGGR